MANQISDVLNLLASAYPNFGEKVPDPQATLDLYERLLSDVPAPLLLQAAEQHIRSGKWFPSVAELRAQAYKLSGVIPGQSFAALAPNDTLVGESFRLEDEFYQEGRLDLTAWEHLAAAFERLDRPARAEYTHQKLARLKAQAAPIPVLSLPVSQPVEGVIP